MSCGELWNTMVMVARAASLWRLISPSPDLAACSSKFQAAIGIDRESALRNKVYQMLSHANLSTLILTHCPDRLLVVPIRNVLWSDWGRGAHSANVGAHEGPSLSPRGCVTEQEVERAGVAFTL